MWCSWGFSNDFAKKMVEVMIRNVPVGGGGRGVCVCVLCWLKKKNKRGTRMRVTGQREKRGNCEICGGGGWVRWGSWEAHGNQKISPPPPPPFFWVWLGCYIYSPSGFCLGYPFVLISFKYYMTFLSIYIVI